MGFGNEVKAVSPSGDDNPNRGRSERPPKEKLTERGEAVAGWKCWTRWYFWATHSRLEPIRKTAETVRRHAVDQDHGLRISRPQPLPDVLPPSDA